MGDKVVLLLFPGDVMLGGPSLTVVPVAPTGLPVVETQPASPSASAVIAATELVTVRLACVCMIPRFGDGYPAEFTAAVLPGLRWHGYLIADHVEDTSSSGSVVEYELPQSLLQFTCI